MKQHVKRLILGKLFCLYKRLIPFSNKFLLLFEPLIPFFIFLFLRRELTKLKKNGAIKTYSLNILRVSKLHYSVKFKLIITPNQIGSLVLNILNDLFRGLHDE